MGDDLDQQIERLQRAIAHFQMSSKRALGFVDTITYEEITFDVSRRFVMADLAPLHFFHLIEPIDEGGPQPAAVRLYERLLPLLSCRHEWTALKRAEDDHVRKLIRTGSSPGPFICKACTAYSLGTVLPMVGRGPAA